MNRHDALQALKLPDSATDAEIEQCLKRKVKALRSGLKNALNQEMRETYEQKLRDLDKVNEALGHVDSSIQSRGREDSNVDALALMLSMTHSPRQESVDFEEVVSESKAVPEPQEDSDDPLDVDDDWLEEEDQSPVSPSRRSLIQSLKDVEEDDEEERVKTTEASVATYDAFYDLDLDELDPDHVADVDAPASEITQGSQTNEEPTVVEAVALESQDQPNEAVEVDEAFVAIEVEDILQPLGKSPVDESEIEAPADLESELETVAEASGSDPETPTNDSPLENYSSRRQAIEDARVVDESRFEILEKLPSSTSYQHFKARDRLRGETVLLKTLADNLAQDPSSQRTFQQTAIAISRINHPNLIKVFDLHEVSGQLYVSMEWLEPYSLRDEIETRKRNGHCFESYELMRISRELRDVLATLHLVVPHCGMKPENIHYQESGALKLMDIDPFDHRSSYAAQELQQSNSNDAFADQFSMAVLLAELASVPSDKIGNYERVGKDLPGGFDPAIQRAQSNDPEQRFPDLDSFVASLSSRGEFKRSLKRPLLQLCGVILVFILGMVTASQKTKFQKAYERLAASSSEEKKDDSELREVKTDESSLIPRVETAPEPKTEVKKTACVVCKESKSCVTCRGQGKLMDPCKTCKGLSKIKVDCKECDPKGQRACTSCSGSGQLTPTCIQCDGKKTLECEECLGKKTLTKTCRVCKGKKSGPCAQCKSKGIVTNVCKDCKGSKIAPCKVCKGKVDYFVPCDYVLNYLGKDTPCVKGVVVCPDCAGKGKVSGDKCDLCDGSGRQDCLKFCNKGKIRKSCEACQKTGRVPCYNKRCRLRGSWQIECPQCLGLKRASCENCKATGKERVPCQSCEGKGLSPCSSCLGKGQLKRSCPSCKGKGSSKCYQCQGTKTIEQSCEECENGRHAKDCLHCKGSGRCPEFK